jgi:hypothetical protein
MPCPPEQFIAIRGVVAAVLLRAPRHVGQGRSSTVVDDVEFDTGAIDHRAQQLA